MGDEQLRSLPRRQRQRLRDLLIAATATADRPARGTSLERFLDDAPVQMLPNVALVHRVAGTVAHGLRADADRVPPTVMARLEAMRRRATLRHLLATGAIGPIAEGFDRAGIGWVVLKGPVLARLYPEVGDRSYADVDLLVSRHDFPRAVDVLEQLGHRHVIEDWWLAEQMMAGQVELIGPNDTHVDLHWHLHYSTHDRAAFALDPEAMLERRRSVNVSGLEVPALDPVDTLRTVAFHAARSDGHRLVWYQDVDRCWSVERPDPDDFVGRTVASGCGPPVGVILDRTRWLLGTPIDEAIVAALAPPTLLATDRIVRRHVHPVRLDDRPTVVRALTRSYRSTMPASVLDVPGRVVHHLRRRLAAPDLRRRSDPAEKQSYLAAVKCSTE